MTYFSDMGETMGYLIPETYDSDHQPRPLGPNTTPFIPVGVPRSEEIDRTREAIYDAHGNLIGAREHLRITRRTEIDADAMYRARGWYDPPSALEVAWRTACASAVRLAVAILYVLAGAFGGLLTCAAAVTQWGALGGIVAGLVGAVGSVILVSLWLSHD